MHHVGGEGGLTGGSKGMSEEIAQREFDQRTRDFGPNEWLLREMHVRYLEESSYVSQPWHQVFEDYDKPSRRPEFVEGAEAPGAVSTAGTDAQASVVQLMNQYRVRGHLMADLDPLSDLPRAIRPDLDPRWY